MLTLSQMNWSHIIKSQPITTFFLHMLIFNNDFFFLFFIQEKYYRTFIFQLFPVHLKPRSHNRTNVIFGHYAKWVQHEQMQTCSQTHTLIQI